MWHPALNSPAELRSLKQSSVKMSCHKGQRGPLDSGPAAPEPWRCTSHRGQSKTPGELLQLKHKVKEIRLVTNRHPSQTIHQDICHSIPSLFSSPTCLQVHHRYRRLTLITSIINQKLLEKKQKQILVRR